MTWSVVAPTPETPMCRLELSGAVSADEVTQSFEQCVRVCFDAQIWLVLTDATGMTGGHSVLDVYPLVGPLSELGVQDRFREAIVYPIEPAAAANVRFWEDAAVNRGLRCAAFATEADAVAWLMS